jgi:hypothetical protein
MKNMKCIYQQQYVFVLAIVGLLAASLVQAAHNPQPLPDTSRCWSLSAGVAGGFDDNTTSRPGGDPQKQSSATTILSPKLFLNLPLDQSFLGLRYGYEGIYYWDRTGGDRWDQNHTVDLIASHRFNPRLQLDFNDSFRRGISPELVDLVNGVRRVQQQVGDYFYNKLEGGITYNISRLWSVVLNNSWEYWGYDDPGSAATNGRNIYSPLAALNYVLDPSTILGLNFRYTVVDYRDPGQNNAKNSNSENIFLSITHTFNPQLTGQLSAGGGVTEFGDNHSTASPYCSGSLSYRYAKVGSVSVGGSYFLYTSDQNGYRSADTLASYLAVQQGITSKLISSLSINYVYSKSGNPDPTIAAVATTEPKTDSWSANMGLVYNFTRWLSADINYSYTLYSSQIPGSSFIRNRVNAGLRFTY